MSEIFTMGEPMVVFIAEKPGTFSEVENYSRGLAGAELNFSIGVTRLGHTASYFTKLGKDPYGAYIHEFIEKEKIDGEKVLFTEEYLTGSYLKTKVLEGDPAVYYFRKNSDDLKKAQSKKVVIPKNTVSCNSRCFWVSRRLVSFLESSEQISRFGAAFKKPPPKRRFLVHQQGLEPGTR